MTEAEHLFRCFVGRREPSPALLRSYEDALARLDIGPDPVTARLVAAGADLSSAELALRRRDAANGLTRRALVLMALAEARPELAPLFTPRAASRPRFWLDFAFAPLVGLFQWLKGTLIVWRHVGAR